jgi:ribose 5-phosphate isomerase B
MRIALGSDHIGYGLKQDIARRLAEEGYTVFDLGTHDENPVDHPDFAAAVARAVADGRADRGVMVAGNGAGPCIAANKVAGVRAVAGSDLFSTRTTVEHDHANVLCLGSQVTGPGLAAELVKTFVSATVDNDERHRRRLAKLEELEGL